MAGEHAGSKSERTDRWRMERNFYLLFLQHSLLQLDSWFLEFKLLLVEKRTLETAFHLRNGTNVTKNL